MNRSRRAVVVYGVVLYLIWALYTLFIYPNINFDALIFDTIEQYTIKGLIWLLPAIILINKYGQEWYIKRKENYSFKCNWWVCIVFIAIMVVVQLVVAYFIKGNIFINDTFRFLHIILCIGVGLTEEFVFRGCFLNCALKEKGKWITLIINGILFLIIHFPIWIVDGVFVSAMASGAFVQIIILGVVFGYSYIKTKSIWVPVVLHIVWNILCFMYE